jgi:predicted nucleic acid-binding protein
MHAFFELAAAMKTEKVAGRLTISKAFTDSAPFPLTFVPIDEHFFTHYFDETLPPIKAGDLIFLALAKGSGAALISEDQQLLQAAKECGVVAYSIDEYLACQT